MNARTARVRHLARRVLRSTPAVSIGTQPVRNTTWGVHDRRRSVLSQKVHVTARWRKMIPVCDWGVGEATPGEPVAGAGDR